MIRRGLPRTVKEIAGFLRYVAGRYRRDGGSRLAASLSYTSLLSLVPLLAIALAMLAAFPVFDPVRKQLVGLAFEHFVPAVGEAVRLQVNRFVANAGRLTAAGIVGLGFTAVMLLVTIEGALNMVFRVARDRPPMSRLVVYWTLLTLGPLLMGAALSLQGYFTAMKQWDVARQAVAYVALPLPTVLTAMAFAVLFVIIPNRRVRLADALVGAVVSALLFAGLRWGFGVYIASSKAYTSLYGAVAAVPIFLFWTFLSWAVVLVGAEITAALPEWRAGYHRAEPRARGIRRLTLALDVLAHLLAASRLAKPGLTRRDLLARTAVAERDLSSVLARLRGAELIAPTVGKRLLLSRDPGVVTLEDVLLALDMDLALDDGIAVAAPWRAAVAPLISDAAASRGHVLGVPLLHLLDQPVDVADTGL